MVSIPFNEAVSHITPPNPEIITEISINGNAGEKRGRSASFFSVPAALKR
jgi:hypothetical protein